MTIKCVYRPRLNAATAISYYNSDSGLIAGVPPCYFQDNVSEPFYTEYYDGQEDVTDERIWVDMFQMNTRLVVFSYMNIGTYQYVDCHRYMRIWETMEERDYKMLERPVFTTANTNWISLGAAKAIKRQASYPTSLAFLMYDEATNLVMTHEGLLQLDIPNLDKFETKPLKLFGAMCHDKDAMGIVLINGEETLCYKDRDKLVIR